MGRPLKGVGPARGGFRKRDDVPAGMGDLAKRRTEFLLDVAKGFPETPLRALFASAYLQGIEDCFQTIEHHPELADAGSRYFGA